MTSEQKRINEILHKYKETMPLEERVLESKWLEALRLLFNGIKEEELSYEEFVCLISKWKYKNG